MASACVATPVSAESQSPGVEVAAAGVPDAKKAGARRRFGPFESGQSFDLDMACAAPAVQGRASRLIPPFKSDISKSEDRSMVQAFPETDSQEYK